MLGQERHRFDRLQRVRPLQLCFQTINSSFNDADRTLNVIVQKEDYDQRKATRYGDLVRLQRTLYLTLQIYKLNLA